MLPFPLRSLGVYWQTAKEQQQKKKAMSLLFSLLSVQKNIQALSPLNSSICPFKKPFPKEKKASIELFAKCSVDHLWFLGFL